MWERRDRCAIDEAARRLTLIDGLEAVALAAQRWPALTAPYVPLCDPVPVIARSADVVNLACDRMPSWPFRHRILSAQTDMWRGTRAPLGDVTLRLVGPRKPLGVQRR